MRNLSLLLVLILASFATPASFAAESQVDISMPKDGAKLDAMEQIKVEYNITLAGHGDHIHAYVDGKETAVLRELKGSYTLETLAPGKHEICIKIVNKGHTPIGAERCIKVEAQ